MIKKLIKWLLCVLVIFALSGDTWRQPVDPVKTDVQEHTCPKTQEHTC